MAIIYHYTDAVGVIGIVARGILWATDIHYMNDHGEADYALRRIDEFLVDRTPADPTTTEANFTNSARSYLQRFWREGAAPSSFIACFSTNGDQLSQWRAYGRSKGFSIGFDESALQGLARDRTGLNFTIRKVSYRQAEQDMLLDAQYVPAFAPIRTGPRSMAEIQGASVGFLLDATRLAPSLKHPAFEEESEIRLHLFLETKDLPQVVKFRDSVMGLTPYVEIPLAQSPPHPVDAILEVIVGPQRHPEEAKRAAQQLLACNGLPDVEVRMSEVPLRA